MTALPGALIAAFDRQVRWCTGRAPFMARLLALSRDWLEEDGAARAAFEAVADDPLAAAVSLRWAAALHHLALRGLQPWAALWPPQGLGLEADDAALRDAIERAWRARREDVDAALARAPQTNEVMRSAALLPGLLHVAAATRLPLELMEIGASAGLNVWCDRYRYTHAGWQWGDPAAAVSLGSEWVGPPPPAASLTVRRRAACDLHPVDLRRPDDGLRLLSFIWPDQPERLDRLRIAEREAALWMAAEGFAVQPRAALDFVREALAERQPGAASVLMHSVMWQYMSEVERAGIEALMHEAGAAATARSPLAWLRFEPQAPDQPVQLSCRLWDGGAGCGAEHLLALCHPHGARIEWHG